MKAQHKDTQASYKPSDLYFIPLGGSEEFGVNCNLYIHNNDWLVVDLGMGFADEKAPGVDILLPDVSYLAQNRERLCGIIITHAHEDHIGAVSYLWPKLKCPIYCTPFTAAVLRHKFRENPACADAKITEIDTQKEISIGSFNVGFAHMAHSIPETVSLFLKTGAANVLHSADWNLDPSPVVGNPTDLKKLKSFAKEGVHAYIGDSTNAIYPGRAGSEKEVEVGMSKTFEGCNGKIIVTLFASNVGRIQTICRAAKSNDRKVLVLGRSLHRMVACAQESGYLGGIDNFVNESELDQIEDQKLVIIATGSQGESRAAMARISRGDWRGLTLGKNDTAVFSSRAIPGNEKDIERVKNNLVTSGVKIIDASASAHKIHVSGHPYRDEIYEMLTTLNPVSVIPVHGEHLHLSGQAEIARGCGIRNIEIPANGSIIKIGKDKLERKGEVTTGLLAVESRRIVRLDHAGIKERRKLQFSGAMHVSLVLDGAGDIYLPPRISLSGLIDMEEGEEDLTRDLLDSIYDICDRIGDEEIMDDEFIENHLRKKLRQFVSDVLGFRPVTHVHVLRIED